MPGASQTAVVGVKQRREGNARLAVGAPRIRAERVGGEPGVGVGDHGCHGRRVRAAGYVQLRRNELVDQDVGGVTAGRGSQDRDGLRLRVRSSTQEQLFDRPQVPVVLPEALGQSAIGLRVDDGARLSRIHEGKTWPDDARGGWLILPRARAHGEHGDRPESKSSHRPSSAHQRGVRFPRTIDPLWGGACA